MLDIGPFSNQLTVEAYTIILQEPDIERWWSAQGLACRKEG